jgi:hypothetical protein
MPGRCIWITSVRLPLCELDCQLCRVVVKVPKLRPHCPGRRKCCLRGYIRSCVPSSDPLGDLPRGAHTRCWVLAGRRQCPFPVTIPLVVHWTHGFPGSLRRCHRAFRFGHGRSRLGASLRRPTSAGGLDVRYASPRLLEHPPQQELDLGVGTAQLVGGPTSKRVMDRRVETEEDGLALSHGGCPR